MNKILKKSVISLSVFFAVLLFIFVFYLTTGSLFEFVTEYLPPLLFIILLTGIEVAVGKRAKNGGKMLIQPICVLKYTISIIYAIISQICSFWLGLFGFGFASFYEVCLLVCSVVFIISLIATSALEFQAVDRL